MKVIVFLTDHAVVHRIIDHPSENAGQDSFPFTPDSNPIEDNLGNRDKAGSRERTVERINLDGRGVNVAQSFHPLPDVPRLEISAFPGTKQALDDQWRPAGQLGH